MHMCNRSVNELETDVREGLGVNETDICEWRVHKSGVW